MLLIVKMKDLTPLVLFLHFPLTFAINLQACRVDSQVLNGATRLGFKSNLDGFSAFADASVMWARKRNISQFKHRVDKAL